MKEKGTCSLIPRLLLPREIIPRMTFDPPVKAEESGNEAKAEAEEEGERERGGGGERGTHCGTSVRIRRPHPFFFVLNTSTCE